METGADMTAVKNLSDISRGHKYMITGYSDPHSEYSEKLVKMGFVEGTIVQRTGTEISDPIILNLRHSRVALRRNEAKAVLVRDTE